MAGRPSKLTPELADDLVLLLAAGASSACAARAVGVGERSVRRWLRNGLAAQVEQAKAAAWLPWCSAVVPRSRIRPWRRIRVSELTNS